MSRQIDVKQLQSALDRAVASGAECGVQLSIYEHGFPVADLCAGYADMAHTVPVTLSTLFPIYSVGKTVFASAFHLLRERLGFSYDGRVAEVWPEFGCRGKEDTRIRHILTHCTGLHQLPDGVAEDAAELADWAGMCRKLAAAAPLWVPGSRCAYQSITYAWLAGETANRLLGGSFHDFLRREVLKPLGVEKDFFYGIDETLEPRTAAIDDRPAGGNYCWVSSFIGNPAIRRGFIPSANGFAAARALAKIANALWASPGNPQPLLQRETVDYATVLRASEVVPPSAEDWAKFGLGYVLPVWLSAGGDIFGQGGACGAEMLYCKSRELALGFTKNIVTSTDPVHPLRDEISRILDLPIRHW